MLLIQMPGALLVMYFQAVMNTADVTTWAPYGFQFLQQLVLVVMCFIFKFTNKNDANLEEETEHLLPNEDPQSNKGLELAQAAPGGISAQED